jgi:hypothetical protein
MSEPLEKLQPEPVEQYPDGAQLVRDLTPNEKRINAAIERINELEAKYKNHYHYPVQANAQPTSPPYTRKPQE